MVGGVGGVAIMMIPVTEPTREIGVRKALGATRREILWQFLVEAATLTLVGGIVGMIVGGLIAFLISALTPLPAHVPLGSVVAARLDPGEASRYDWPGTSVGSIRFQPCLSTKPSAWPSRPFAPRS